MTQKLDAIEITFPTLIANGSGHIVALQNADGSKKWRWKIVSQNVSGPGGSVEPLLYLLSDTGNIPISITENGMFMISGIWGFYNLVMDPSYGPGLRVGGDAVMGDVRFVGSTPYQVTAVANNGAGLIRCTVASTSTPLLTTNDKIWIAGGIPNLTQGVYPITVINGTQFDIQGSAFTSGTLTGLAWYGKGEDVCHVGQRQQGAIPSKTVFGTSFQDAVDSPQGGGFIIVTPNSAQTAIGEGSGQVNIVAYDNAGAGTLPGCILFSFRSGPGTYATRLYISPSGDLLPTANNASDIGSASARIKKIYATDIDVTNLTQSGGVKVLAASATQVSLTGTTAETTFATISVPANAMGANGILRITTQMGGSGLVGGKNLRTKFGGVTFNNGGTSSTAIAGRFQTQIHNRSATSQVGSSATQANFSGDSNGNAVVTATVDTTAAQNIVITGQLNSASDTITLESYLVELILP